MIFVSYFSIIDKIKPNNYLIIFEFLIPSFGIIVTLFWIYVNLKSYSLLGTLKDFVLENDKDIKLAQDKKPIKLIPSNMVIGIFLPILILLLWSILLFIAVFMFLAPHLGI